jgi:hypothetical protein
LESGLDASTLFEAGFAAHHAGQRDSSLKLLRQALWLTPESDQAQQAKELIREAMRVN